MGAAQITMCCFWIETHKPFDFMCLSFTLHHKFLRNGNLMFWAIHKVLVVKETREHICERSHLHNNSMKSPSSNMHYTCFCCCYPMQRRNRQSEKRRIGGETGTNTKTTCKSWRNQRNSDGESHQTETQNELVKYYHIIGEKKDKDAAHRWSKLHFIFLQFQNLSHHGPKPVSEEFWLTTLGTVIDVNKTKNWDQESKSLTTLHEPTNRDKWENLQSSKRGRQRTTTQDMLLFSMET